MEIAADIANNEINGESGTFDKHNETKARVKSCVINVETCAIIELRKFISFGRGGQVAKIYFVIKLRRYEGWQSFYTVV